MIILDNVLREKKIKYRVVIEKFTDKINKFINTLNKCAIQPYDSLETIIFKKYLELSDMVKVTTYINDQGHRIKTNSYKEERKYTSNDIADIVKKPDDSVSIELINAIKEMKDIDRMLLKMNAKRLLK